MQVVCEHRQKQNRIDGKARADKYLALPNIPGGIDHQRQDKHKKRQTHHKNIIGIPEIAPHNGVSVRLIFQNTDEHPGYNHAAERADKHSDILALDSAQGKAHPDYRRHYDSRAQELMLKRFRRGIQTASEHSAFENADKILRLLRKFYGIVYPFGAPVFGQRRIVFALSFVGAEARRGDCIPGILRKLHLIARQDADSVEQSALGGDYYFDIFSLALHKRGLVIPADIDRGVDFAVAQPSAFVELMQQADRLAGHIILLKPVRHGGKKHPLIPRRKTHGTGYIFEIAPAFYLPVKARAVNGDNGGGGKMLVPNSACSRVFRGACLNVKEGERLILSVNGREQR